MTTDTREPITLTHMPTSESPETLLYYDGPVLLWLPVTGRRLLAYALPDEPGAESGWRSPFIVIEMDEAAAARVSAGTEDLRTATLAADTRYYLPDLYASELVLLRRHEPLPEDWLPGDLRLTPSA
ncbi:hypothetical protein AB4Y45_32640 [Paraburkholderia sp. EG287A]|uniref:hypothetical protein n=1 Tax=Paraburkholderia sp. EG287A TaxID=3237012 RepID=UPI0034D34BBE